jgi:hypothetical protein
LAGNIYKGPSIINCWAENITITASGSNNSYIGGLVGFTGTYEGDPTSVSGCLVSNVTITVSNATAQVGGLIGGCWPNTGNPEGEQSLGRDHVNSGTVNGCVITGGVE